MPSDPASHLDEVGHIVQGVADLGLEPVLIGGMALVAMGSRRVTRDFDFVIARPGERLARLLDLLRLDAPVIACFMNPRTGLRIDLLFDSPIPVAALVPNATSTKVRSRVFRNASASDLLRLEKIARAGRTAPGDAEDIAFLEARRADRTR